MQYVGNIVKLINKLRYLKMKQTFKPEIEILEIFQFESLNYNL